MVTGTFLLFGAGSAAVLVGSVGRLPLRLGAVAGIVPACLLLMVVRKIDTLASLDAPGLWPPAKVMLPILGSGVFLSLVGLGVWVLRQLGGAPAAMTDHYRFIFVTGYVVTVAGLFVIAFVARPRFRERPPNLAGRVDSAWAQAVDAGVAAFRDGRLAAAEVSFRAALESPELQSSGELGLAVSLGNLASVCCAQGGFAEAVPLYERVFPIRIKFAAYDYPDDDVNVARVLVNLVAVYQLSGRAVDADALASWAAAILLEGELSDEELALWGLYDARGDFAEAPSPVADDPVTNASQGQRVLVRESRPEGEPPAEPPADGLTRAPDLAEIGGVVTRLLQSHRDRIRAWHGQRGEGLPLWIEQNERNLIGVLERLLGHRHPLVADRLYRLAEFCQAHGRTEEAEALHRQALEIREQALGARALKTGHSLSALARIAEQRGAYAEAEALLRRALDITERQKRENLSVIIENHLDRLVHLCRLQGKATEAERLERRRSDRRDARLDREGRLREHAMKSFQQIGLNIEPPEVSAVRLRAEACEERGAFAEAEPLRRRVLELREHALGREHPHLAEPINELAGLYRKMGRLDEAEALLERLLGIVERDKGPDDGNVATILNNLALLSQELGRPAQAKERFRRAVEVGERAFGAEHAEVANALQNLAGLNSSQGQYTEAEPLLRRALAIQGKILGPGHAAVGNTLVKLGQLHCALERYEEAAALLERAVGLLEAALGPESWDLAPPLSGLAIVYHSQGRYVEAESVSRRALSIAEKIRGPADPEVATNLRNLGLHLAAQGRHAETQPLLERALEIAERGGRATHPLVATILNDLGLLHQTLGNGSDAEELFRRAIEMTERDLGSASPELAPSLHNLADLTRAAGRYGEAEALFVRALGIMEKAFGPEHHRLVPILVRYAMLLRETGRGHAGDQMDARARAIGDQHSS